jgi:hypothetical protein
MSSRGAPVDAKTEAKRDEKNSRMPIYDFLQKNKNIFFLNFQNFFQKYQNVRISNNRM